MNPRTLLAACAAAVVLLAACNSSDETQPPQTGVLSNFPFTVVAGSVTQGADNDPVVVSASGAVLIFDEALTTLVEDPDNFRAIVLLQMADGGQVAVGAFGTTTNLANAYAIGATRTGSTFEYAFFYGYDETPDETDVFFANPASATGSLYFRAEFRVNPMFALYAWAPWDSLPGDCTGGPVSNSGSPPGGLGTGTQLGLGLQDVTVEELTFVAGDFSGC